ncbi:MAG: twin-arginine translocation signal domain-containing protein [Alphaproteobacteria bacterium]|nr:twin-arginine translocation signal domain-containing protein [Alphaproteobacteria bacterium]
MTEESKTRTDGTEGALETGRRSFLKTASLIGAGALAGAMHGKFGGAPLVSEAHAQTPPAQAPWWPSRWGAGDEAGASNWITPAKVLDTVQLIRDGKVYRIGRVYEAGMPLFGTRAFTLRIPGAPTGGPFGSNKLVYNDEFLATEIGQVGTQFDGLGHIGVQLGRDGDRNEMRFYNGHTSTAINDANGLKKLGIEKLKPLFTRGHLIDMVALKGAMMDAGQEITAADIRAALARQDTPEAEIKQGDAIFFHTGWGSLWMKNNDRYNSGAPGIGLEATRWIVDKGLCLAGADTWPVECVPNPDPNLAFACHAELIAKNGIFIHENLNFDELIADRKTRFAYIFTPSPIKGATGANGAPIAVT